jgi:hypothetical protein
MIKTDRPILPQVRDLQSSGMQFRVLCQVLPKCWCISTRLRGVTSQNKSSHYTHRRDNFKSHIYMRLKYLRFY